MPIANLLIVYTSIHQQTYKVAQYLAQQLDANCQVEVVAMAQVTSQQLEKADAIVIGAHIRYGKYPNYVVDFVNKNAALLNHKASAFFGLSLVARKPQRDLIANNQYIQKFLRQINWQPKLVALFAGAVKYTQYNLVEKFFIRLIMYITKGDTDTSQDVEYTNWDKVQRFAKQIAQDLLSK